MGDPTHTNFQDIGSALRPSLGPRAPAGWSRWPSIQARREIRWYIAVSG
jgi:hypothetical protein